jgi:hypothetical protein
VSTDKPPATEFDPGNVLSDPIFNRTKPTDYNPFEPDETESQQLDRIGKMIRENVDRRKPNTERRNRGQAD